MLYLWIIVVVVLIAVATMMTLVITASQNQRAKEVAEKKQAQSERWDEIRRQGDQLREALKRALGGDLEVAKELAKPVWSGVAMLSFPESRHCGGCGISHSPMIFNWLETSVREFQFTFANWLTEAERSNRNGVELVGAFDRLVNAKRKMVSYEIRQILPSHEIDKAIDASMGEWSMKTCREVSMAASVADSSEGYL